MVAQGLAPERPPWQGRGEAQGRGADVEGFSAGKFVRRSGQADDSTMLPRQTRVTSQVEFVRALLARKTVYIRTPNADWVSRPLLAAASGAGFVEQDSPRGARLFVHRKRARRARA